MIRFNTGVGTLSRLMLALTSLAEVFADEYLEAFAFADTSFIEVCRLIINLPTKYQRLVSSPE